MNVTKADLDALKNKAETYQHNAFMYRQMEDFIDYQILEESERLLALFGYNEENHLSEIVWAANDLEALLPWVERHASALMSFIPKAWHQPLLDAGCKEYGVLRDYWCQNLEPFKAKRILTYASMDDTMEISSVTIDCLLESREFHGETEAMVQAWLLGKEPNLNDVHGKDAAILIDRDHGKIRGVVFVACYGHESPKGPVLWLREIAVKRSYQGQGIGRKLLIDALHYGTLHGCTRSFLCADDLNKNAIGLYQSLGYVPDMNDQQIDLVTL